MVATIVVDKTGAVLGEPQFSSFGLLESEEGHKLKLIELVKQSIEALPADHKGRNDMVETAVRTTIRRFLSENYGKKPLIEIHMVRI